MAADRTSDLSREPRDTIHLRVGTPFPNVVYHDTRIAGAPGVPGFFSEARAGCRDGVELRGPAPRSGTEADPIGRSFDDSMDRTPRVEIRGRRDGRGAEPRRRAPARPGPAQGARPDPRLARLRGQAR